MRTIKRYANRKLYDTQTSKYVTLDDLAGLIREGEEIMVIDNPTGEDISRQTLAQIIHRLEKKDSDFMPVQLLRDLIARGGSSVVDTIRRSISASVEKVTRWESEVEVFVARMIERGVMTREEGDRFISRLLRGAGKARSQLEDRIDEHIRWMLASLNIPTADEVADLNSKIDRAIARIDQLMESPKRSHGKR